MKKVIFCIIAAAMLTASTYAAEIAEEEIVVEAEVVEAVTASSHMVPREEEPVPPDLPTEDIAFEEPVANEGYMFDEDILPEEEMPDGYNSVDTWPKLGNIDEYLAMNGYPDYISFICNGAAAINGYDPSSGEEYQPKMTYWWDVGVVNATAAQKAEIQALIDELYPIENIITFVDCTYSYAEREAMLPEIRETVEKLFPTVSIIDVVLIRNTEQIALHLDFPVDGDVPEPDMVKEKMYAIYGDLLFMGDFGVTTDDADAIEIDDLPTVGIGATTEIAMEEIGEEEIGVATNVDGADAPTVAPAAPTTGNGGSSAVTTSVETVPESIPLPEDEGEIEVDEYDDGEPAPAPGGDVDSAPAVGEVIAITPDEHPAGNNTVLWICIASALVVVLGAAAFVYKAKLIPVFATSDGDVTPGKVSKRQAEEAVKNSEVVPDDEILQAIKEKID